MKALRIPYIISIIFYLYMGVIVMPAASRMLLEVSTHPECVVILDLEFLGFNRETVLQSFSCMGEEGLAYYTKIEKLQDVFYPLSYGLFFGLTIFFLGLYVGFSRKRAAGLAILPLLTTLLDFIENMGLLRLVKEYPAISAESVSHASTANQFKWIFAVISFTLLFVLAIWALKVRFTKARSVLYKYYQILGLSPGSSAAEVKRAYRKLALRYHPDVNKEPGAKERFLLITEAYNYLLNPPKHSSSSPEKQKKAEKERVKRAKAAASRAARQRYAAFKKQQEMAQGRAYSQAVSTLVALVFLIGAIYFGYKYINTWYINENADEAVATVIKRGVRHFWLKYEVEGETYVKKFSGTRSKFYLVAPNGMPVFNDEQFTVIYRKENPKRCYVDYDKLSPQTFDVYLEVIAPALQKQYELSPGDVRIECLSLLVFEEYGMDGLANLFFWEESFLENFSNNSLTYTSMIEEPEYQQIVSDCLINE